MLNQSNNLKGSFFIVNSSFLSYYCAVRITCIWSHLCLVNAQLPDGCFSVQQLPGEVLHHAVRLEIAIGLALLCWTIASFHVNIALATK